VKVDKIIWGHESAIPATAGLLVSPLLAVWLYYRDGAWRFVVMNFLMALYTNNGMKHLSEDFRYDFMNSLGNVAVSELLKVIITSFLPDQYRSYVPYILH